MKKFLLSAITVLFTVIFYAPSVFASPTFVLLKFSDDTRFDALNGSLDAPAIQLSERILKRLVQSQKFTLTSLEPLSEDIEAYLYDENVGEYEKFNVAINSGDYNNFFEDGSFDERKAQTIATAKSGKLFRQR